MGAVRGLIDLHAEPPLLGLDDEVAELGIEGAAPDDEEELRQQCDAHDEYREQPEGGRVEHLCPEPVPADEVCVESVRRLDDRRRGDEARGVILRGEDGAKDLEKIGPKFKMLQLFINLV